MLPQVSPSTGAVAVVEGTAAIAAVVGRLAGKAVERLAGKAVERRAVADGTVESGRLAESGTTVETGRPAVCAWLAGTAGKLVQTVAA